MPPQESARGYMAWRAALDKGLLPDDDALGQILTQGEDFAKGLHHAEQLR